MFEAAGFTLEVDQSKQFTGLGIDGRDDPTGGARPPEEEPTLPYPDPDEEDDAPLRV